jgi:hypothetical protein
MRRKRQGVYWDRRVMITRRFGGDPESGRKRTFGRKNKGVEKKSTNNSSSKMD